MRYKERMNRSIPPSEIVGYQPFAPLGRRARGPRYQSQMLPLRRTGLRVGDPIGEPQSDLAMTA